MRKIENYKFNPFDPKPSGKLSTLHFDKAPRENFVDFLKQKFTLLIFLIFVFATYSGLQNLKYNHPAYITQSTPFLESISPILVNIPKKIVENRMITLKEKIVFKGPDTRKKVALTFDADMTPQMKLDLETKYVASYHDKDLIKILSETGTKATLFLSGMWIESYPEIAQSLSQSALFELANHTYSHPAFHASCYGLTQAHESHKMEELEKTQKLLKDITGYDNKLFRFPGGCYSELDLETVSKTGQVAIQWDVAGQDGFNGNTDAIVSNVVDNVKNGSIIVLHMNGYPNDPATAIALPIIISSLRQKGYEFVTVSELLNMEVAKKPENKSLVSNLFLKTRF